MPLPSEDISIERSRWTRFSDRIKGAFDGADSRVCIAFWLFGVYHLNADRLINNVLYVIILSAALDLVGPDVPKGIVLLSDIIPSFTTKLIAPYFIHVVPYSVRIVVLVVLSVIGMLVIAMSPSYTEGGTITFKIIGIALASLSSGAGELSFVGLTHFYGPFSLAAWGSGTGAAGLVGAGAYALATSAMNISVHVTLFSSACLPVFMMLSFFFILPRDPLKSPSVDAYQVVERGAHYDDDDDNNENEAPGQDHEEVQGLLGPTHSDAQKPANNIKESQWIDHMRVSLRRLGKLFVPFMVPMLLVYVAEYVINQGVTPTLLYPLDTTPFKEFRSFYPAYNAIYQVGVFLSRSSTPFFRVHYLYLPSLLQVLNLVVLSLHSMFNFIPSVYIIFAIIFWEGLLGGIVYVNTFAEISDHVPEEEREFSLGATTVSDSAGICIAGFLNHVLGRPSTRFRKFQVFAVVSFWSIYLLRAHKHGPPFIRAISSRLEKKITIWQTTVLIFLWLYLSRNFAKIVGLESPEPLANLYSRPYFRATWITTALDAGYWTAMRIKSKWLRDISSLVFTLYYLIAAEQADEKVRRVRATLTLEHLRVSWNKPTTPYLWALASLTRPRFTRYPPRAIRISRPAKSIHRTPVNAWLYFDGPLSALRDQTCIVLDVPGGGFVAMSPRNSEDKLLSWAGKLKVPVLSIDYQKAPEYAYPFALHECYDVYETIVNTNGRCLGFSGTTRPRIVVTGESAGGSLAVAMVLMVLQTRAQNWNSEDALPRPDGVVLAYPSLNLRVESWMTDEQMSLIQDKSSRQTNKSVIERKQDELRKLTPYTSPRQSVEKLTAISLLKHPEGNSEDKEASDVNKLDEHLKVIDNNKGKETTEIDEVKPLKTRLAVSSMISYVQDRVLTPEMMRAMIILYIGPHQRPDFNTDYYLSPVLAPESLLAIFPKTFIMTGERDPLVDDTVLFAGRLRQAKLHQFRERQELGLEDSQCQFYEKDHIDISLLPGISHGFLQMVGFFPEGWKYITRSAEWIESLFLASELRDSQYSLVQPSHSGTHSSKDRRGSGKHGRNIRSRQSYHHRTLTGESSGDDDRPLEMSMTKMSSSAVDGQADRRKRSQSSGSSHLEALKSYGNEFGSGSEFLATLRSLEKSNRENHPFLPDDMSSGLESPKAVRHHRRSIVSLGSEEDLLDRRMHGLAGGLMGFGDGSQTPGP
ncbi:hypothetical protein N7495_000072 [Penicillium taxi]|uniref:uncharacterized protein n=1 Tax=Penicillium taxi TaxID=168475 RepID=UPI0025458819|nr:uncharacterized protein N7495_000072 [Penicillium taxi]KAJ5907390.1 hypothetical protein N7495_000072 [Penicillium taxi]